MDFMEGSCFLLDDSGGRHPWAIISDPKQSSSEIVIVNFTTYRNKGYEDTSCIVEANEHDSITHESYIYYRRSQIVDLPKLALWFSTDELRPLEPWTPELLGRIRLGASESDFLPFGAERVLSMQGLI